MIVLKLLRPSEIPVKKTDWGVRVKVYYWILCRLMPLYRSGMVYDSIEIDNVLVVHNVRDFWYENEMQRFNVVFMHDLVANKLPYNIKNRKYKRYHCFSWTESLVVFNNGKSYHIKHGKDLTVETEINGIFKASNAKELMQCTEFVAKTKQENYVKQKENTNKHKIQVKDTIHEVITPFNKRESEKKHKAGFDLNDIF